MKRLVIIEDEVMLRELVAEVLKDSTLCTLVGSAGDGREGWELVQKLQPDVVMLDIKLPSLNGLEVQRHIHELLPQCRMLLFSAYFTTDMVRQALKQGAHGILEKTAGLVEFQHALRTVLEGGTYFGPAVLKLVRNMMLEPERRDSIDGLSPREREILQLIAEGHSTKEIASLLAISVKTAHTHRANLMAKLKLHGVAELTRYAIERGLIRAKPRTA